MRTFKIVSGVFILLAIGSCKPSFDDTKYDRGTADFSSYVSIGNSLTAGYADNALYVDGQLNSYPAMLAKRFSLVGGNGVFNLPLIDADNAINGVSPAPQGTDFLRTTSKLVLGYSTSCDAVTSLGPVSSAPPITLNSTFLAPIGASGPYNNLGIPGIKSFQIDNPSVGGPLNPNSPLFNPYYARMASVPATSTILGDALLVNPTFFTLWLGNNDVLSYALSGGSSLFPQPNMNAGDITPLDTFKVYLSRTVDKMVSLGAKGAIANIPDVTDIPYFTTVPYNALSLDSASAAALNVAYAGAFTFNVGANAFIVKDTSTVGFRQIKSDELICLSVPQDSLKCGGWGSAKPIPDAYWLDKGEIDLIKAKTSEYNAFIKVLADQHALAHVDMNLYFKTVTKGIVFNGVDYSPVFVSGGAFSLDGVHPNKRGYALIANQYIKAINDKFGSNIPEIDVNSYPGIVFP